MQFHEIIRLEDPDKIFAEGGAAEAMTEAKKAGKVRYIGFTGHKDPFANDGDCQYTQFQIRRRAAAAQRNGRAFSLV
jgi:predicted aldo/keto reductase-like oxidoreductase